MYNKDVKNIEKKSLNKILCYWRSTSMVKKNELQDKCRARKKVINFVATGRGEH